LVFVAILDSWSAPAWSALAGWVTATVAVAAGGIAFGQLGEARRLRRERSQPYVAAFTDSSGEVDERFIYLVVANFGATAAFDVGVTIEPPPRRATGNGYEEVWIPHQIPVLVPGQEWRTLWDFGPRRADSDLPSRHEAHVSLQDSQGRSYSFSYILDWQVYAQRMKVTTYGVHHAAKALREIDKKLGRWSERGELAVSVRDGEADDRRRQAELDGLRAAEGDAPSPPGGE